MNASHPTDKYAVLIRRIRRGRKIVLILTAIAFLLVLAAGSPLYIGSFRNPIVDYAGASPLTTVWRLVLVAVFASIVHAQVCSPLTNALHAECNPEKHLILNTAIYENKTPDYVFAQDFFYMGNFKAALEYADKMIAGTKAEAGFFYKARCHFFAGEYDALKDAVGQYEQAASAAKRKTQREKIRDEKIRKAMHLMIAVADGNTESIAACRHIEPWNPSKASKGYIDCLCGMAAEALNEKEEAIRLFTAVKETCEKTFLARVAEDHLAQLA